MTGFLELDPIFANIFHGIVYNEKLRVYVSELNNFDFFIKCENIATYTRLHGSHLSVKAKIVSKNSLQVLNSITVLPERILHLWWQKSDVCYYDDRGVLIHPDSDILSYGDEFWDIIRHMREFTLLQQIFNLPNKNSDLSISSVSLCGWLKALVLADLTKDVTDWIRGNITIENNAPDFGFVIHKFLIETKNEWILRLAEHPSLIPRLLSEQF